MAEEILENKTDSQPQNLNNPPVQETRTGHSRALSTNLLGTIILLSVIFGAVGGALGTGYVLRNPSAASRIFGTPSTNALPTVKQTVQLTEESAVTNVVKQASPAVVSIVISKDLSKIPGYGNNPFGDLFPFYYSQPQQNSQPNVQQVGAGSGFFVSADGLILTNKHVVSDEQASYTVVTSDGKTYDAKVLARDPRNDLALVKVDIQNAPHLNLADSSNLEIGQTVIAIGNSLGQYQNTVTTGVVSGIGRSITAGGNDGSEQLEGVIQTDAAINPGNSGGPLLNVAGQVIGINTAIDQQGQLVGFAIPSNDANKAVASFQQNGQILRPYLGVRYTMITKTLATSQNLPRDYGALVVRGSSGDPAVLPGSPADKAGIVENDIIEEVNGAKLDENNTLSKMLKDKNVGDTVNLKVYDRGNEKTVNVVLEAAK